MAGDVIGSARRALGPVGAMLPNVPFAPPVPFDRQRDAARALEGAGWPAVWVNEGVGGKDVFTQLALLLSATERVTFATGVANVWARPPETAQGAAATLADAFPDRLVLGLGVGYPFQAAVVGRAFERPAQLARDYLERMDRPVEMTPGPSAPFARILAASGPRMLAVAAERADGALTTLVPPRHIAHLREVLGPDKLIVVGLAAAVDDDRDRARRTAATFVGNVVASAGSPYAANLRRLGYTAAELTGAADHVVDGIVAHGGPDEIAAAVRQHREAGADHVRISTIDGDFTEGIDQLLRLGPEFAGQVGGPPGGSVAVRERRGRPR